MIQDEVMRQQQQQPAVRCLVVMRGDRARAAPWRDVEADRRGSKRVRICSAMSPTRGRGDLFHDQRRLTPRRPAPARASPSHTTAVRRMSCRSITACSAPISVPLRAYRTRAGSAGGRGLHRRHQMMEQNALLQRRQRIDVLHIGGAARDGSNDVVDVGWRQSDQSSISGVITRPLSGMRLGGTTTSRRSFNAGAEAAGVGATKTACGHGCCPAGAGGRSRDGQQRMAAEIEEIIVDADAVEAEDFGADAAQGLLHGSARRDIFAGAAARRGRVGQGLAVELAVGG